VTHFSWLDYGWFLHLTNLPVNELANSLLVVKLEFDGLDKVLGARE
jgi:hypothetical protein